MINTAPERVILVDEHDNQLGLAEKMQAHTLGLLHRAFSVFIFRKHNNNLELLLQQRQQDKYHCGGLWTNTCCSHPRAGETVLQAGERRLYEEMGIRSKLQVLGAFKYRAEFSNGLVEHEYDYALFGKYNDELIQFNQAEVQGYKWVTLEQLQQDMLSHPEKFTPWLGGALAIVLANLTLIQED